MAHGALHAEKLNWHQTVLAKLLSTAWPGPMYAARAMWSQRLTIGSRSIPCYTPVGDFQASLLGALLQEDELSLNISTGSQVSMIAPQLEYGNFQNRPFFDRRLRTITHIPAGRSLSVLVKLLTEIPTAHSDARDDAWTYISQAVERSDSSPLQVDLAFFASSFGDRGAITNIKEEYLTVGHLFLAAFANMAANYQQAARRLSPDESWQNLVFSGGLAQKFPALRKTILSNFRCPYRVCAVEEDTLLGLLVLALAFSGKSPSIAAATAMLARQYASDIKQDPEVLETNHAQAAIQGALQ